MHTPEHLLQQVETMRLDGLYPAVRKVLRALLTDLVKVEVELMAKAKALETLPADFGERVIELEELTVKHNELYEIHQAMRVRADAEHAALQEALQAVTVENRRLIDGLTTSLAALEMDIEDVAAADEPLKAAIDKAVADLAALKASTSASFVSLAAAINGKKAYVAPAAALPDVAGTVLKNDYSVVGGLISTLTLAVNATNGRVNEDTAKINAILAALRAHGIIMS